MSGVSGVIKDWATARNGADWSLTKLICVVAASAMIYNFIASASQDFQSFGVGIAGMLAAMAAKYFVESK